MHGWLDPSNLLAVVAGVTLAAACGLRAFLPLLVLGIAARLGWVPLDPRASWLSATPALIALSVATVVEIAGDKIPIVDHALDGIGTLIRPAAAWFGASALFHGWPSPWGQLLALIPAAVALGVHAVKAKVRLGTTAATLGHGNPVVSTAEDASALGMTLLGLLAPILALVILVFVTIWLLRRRPTRKPEIAAT
jgi:hypothetical protein